MDAREPEGLPSRSPEIDDKGSWTTVVAFGRYEEIHQNPEESEARQRAEQLFMTRHEWWLPGAAKLQGRERADVVVVYRIQLDRVTGRRATRGHD